jgi:hypothetical protein
MAHAAELEATLLAASSPERDAPAPPPPPPPRRRVPSRLKLCSSPPKLRSEGP